jgi:hypothetical protein
MFSKVTQTLVVLRCGILHSSKLERALVTATSICITFLSQVWRHMPVIPATQEVETEGWSVQGQQAQKIAQE